MITTTLIGRLKKPDDIDFTYFVTAHELAHQWWGHQLIGANVQGSNMMSESLAEYSALRVMQFFLELRELVGCPECQYCPISIGDKSLVQISSAKSLVPYRQRSAQMN